MVKVNLIFRGRKKFSPHRKKISGFIAITDISTEISVFDRRTIKQSLKAEEKVKRRIIENQNLLRPGLVWAGNDEKTEKLRSRFPIFHRWKRHFNFLRLFYPSFVELMGKVNVHFRFIFNENKRGIWFDSIVDKLEFDSRR